MGATIQAFEDYMRGKGRDRYTIAVFDKNDNERVGLRRKGSETSIKPTKLQLAEKDGTLIFNRRYDRNDKFGGNFSLSDLKTMANSQLREMRVNTGTNNPTYIIRFKDGADRKKLESWANSMKTVLEPHYTKKGEYVPGSYKQAYDNALKKFTEQGLSKSDARVAARRSAQGVYERALEKAARTKFKKWGIEYIKTDAKDVNRNGTWSTARRSLR